MTRLAFGTALAVVAATALLQRDGLRSNVAPEAPPSRNELGAATIPGDETALAAAPGSLAPDARGLPPELAARPGHSPRAQGLRTQREARRALRRVLGPRWRPEAIEQLARDGDPASLALEAQAADDAAIAHAAARPSSAALVAALHHALASYAASTSRADTAREEDFEPSGARRTSP